MLYAKLQEFAGHALFEEGANCFGYHHLNIRDQFVFYPHKLCDASSKSEHGLKYSWELSKISWYPFFVREKQLDWHGLRSDSSTIIAQGQIFVDEGKGLPPRPLKVGEVVIKSSNPESYAYELDIMMWFKLIGDRSWPTRHAIIMNKTLYDDTKVTMREDLDLTENVLLLGDLVFPDVYRQIRENTLPTYAKTHPTELSKPFGMLELDDPEKTLAALKMKMDGIQP
jgi:hypothetical protein